MEKTSNIGARVDDERLRKMDLLVEAGYYKSRSDLILAGIDLIIDPERIKQALVERTVKDIKENPEVRNELIRVIKNLD